MTNQDKTVALVGFNTCWWLDFNPYKSVNCVTEEYSGVLNSFKTFNGLIIFKILAFFPYMLLRCWFCSFSNKSIWFDIGNLWRELWEAAKPVPAIKQSPLFDEDLAV